MQKKTLSSNILDMKFMKRSKEDRERKEELENYAPVFESGQVKEETGQQYTYNAEPERLVFPRRSYGGQNPPIETLMAEKDGADGDAAAAERGPEADVSDKEMASHYASVVDTVGRKFGTKRQRSAREEAAGATPRAPSQSPALKRTKEFLKPQC